MYRWKEESHDDHLFSQNTLPFKYSRSVKKNFILHFALNFRETLPLLFRKERMEKVISIIFEPSCFICSCNIKIAHGILRDRFFLYFWKISLFRETDPIEASISEACQSHDLSIKVALNSAFRRVWHLCKTFVFREKNEWKHNDLLHLASVTSKLNIKYSSIRNEKRRRRTG